MVRSGSLSLYSEFIKILSPTHLLKHRFNIYKYLRGLPFHPLKTIPQSHVIQSFVTLFSKPKEKPSRSSPRPILPFSPPTHIQQPLALQRAMADLADGVRAANISYFFLAIPKISSATVVREWWH